MLAALETLQLRRSSSSSLLRKLGDALDEDVDEEDLHRVQRVAKPEERTEGDQRQGRARGTELEGQEVLDVVEDGFPWPEGSARGLPSSELNGESHPLPLPGGWC